MKKNQQGFSLIELLIVVVIIGIIAAIAIPSLLASRRASNESAAIGSLKTLVAAQLTYRISYPRYGNFADLNAAGLIDNALGLAPNTKNGYQFTCAATAGVEDRNWDGTALPLIYGTGIFGTGSRSFYTNDFSVIYFNNTGAFALPPASRVVSAGVPIDN